MSKILYTEILNDILSEHKFKLSFDIFSGRSIAFCVVHAQQLKKEKGKILSSQVKGQICLYRFFISYNSILKIVSLKEKNIFIQCCCVNLQIV